MPKYVIVILNHKKTIIMLYILRVYYIYIINHNIAIIAYLLFRVIVNDLNHEKPLFVRFVIIKVCILNFSNYTILMDFTIRYLNSNIINRTFFFSRAGGTSNIKCVQVTIKSIDKIISITINYS
jgi:hypothetical protein